MPIHPVKRIRRLFRTGIDAALRLELPTWGLVLAIYGGWLAVTWAHDDLPWWVLLAAGSWLVAWHMSLQHELIHGHPTSSRRINAALGSVPLSLWLPFRTYRRLHLLHHRDVHLTDPIEDPESYYLTPDRLARLSRPALRLIRFNNTLLGRISIGPVLGIGMFLAEQFDAIWRGDRHARRDWSSHVAVLLPVLGWLAFCEMPLWDYLLFFVYPGFSLALIRSFAEHRASDSEEHRTAIVENARVFGLLFLFNNLHAVHHAQPRLPWYRIPSTYKRDRDSILEANGGLLYAGYGDVARRYLLREHHEPAHPRSNHATEIRSPSGEYAQPRHEAVPA